MEDSDQVMLEEPSGSRGSNEKKKNSNGSDNKKTNKGEAKRPSTQDSSDEEVDESEATFKVGRPTEPIVETRR